MATPDQLTYPTASALRDCLAVFARDTLHGPVASKAVRFGAAGGAVMDGCDCDGTDPDQPGVAGSGRASVRVAQVQPLLSSGAGNRSASGVRVQRCGKIWQVTYELSLVRCFPLSGDGKPLPASDLDQTAQRFLSDQAAVMRTIDCCDYLNRHSGVELVTVTPIGPSGGCAGVQATIRVVQARG
jgi:hypothetical protein